MVSDKSSHGNFPLHLGQAGMKQFFKSYLVTTRNGSLLSCLSPRVSNFTDFNVKRQSPFLGFVRKLVLHCKPTRKPWKERQGSASLFSPCSIHGRWLTEPFSLVPPARLPHDPPQPTTAVWPQLQRRTLGPRVALQEPKSAAAWEWGSPGVHVHGPRLGGLCQPQAHSGRCDNLL